MNNTSCTYATAAKTATAIPHPRRSLPHVPCDTVARIAAKTATGISDSGKNGNHFSALCILSAKMARRTLIFTGMDIPNGKSHQFRGSRGGGGGRHCHASR